MSKLENVFYIGATRRTGKAKATGNPYDICVVQYGTAVQEVQRENMSFGGHGMEVKEIGLDPNALAAFESVEPGERVDLLLSLDPQNPQKNRVSGVQ